MASLKSILLGTLLFGAAIAQTPRRDNRCGPSVNNAPCAAGQCCSAYGWCGATSAYCGVGCISGSCENPSGSDGGSTVSRDASCGGSRKYTCQGSVFGNCCSQFGWCGSGSAYCGTGCQSGFGTCNGQSPKASSSARPSPSALASSQRPSSSTRAILPPKSFAASSSVAAPFSRVLSSVAGPSAPASSVAASSVAVGSSAPAAQSSGPTSSAIIPPSSAAVVASSVVPSPSAAAPSSIAPSSVVASSAVASSAIAASSTAASSSVAASPSPSPSYLPSVFTDDPFRKEPNRFSFTQSNGGRNFISSGSTGYMGKYFWRVQGADTSASQAALVTAVTLENRPYQVQVYYRATGQGQCSLNVSVDNVALSSTRTTGTADNNYYSTVGGVFTPDPANLSPLFGIEITCPQPPPIRGSGKKRQVGTSNYSGFDVGFLSMVATA